MGEKKKNTDVLTAKFSWRIKPTKPPYPLQSILMKSKINKFHPHTQSFQLAFKLSILKCDHQPMISRPPRKFSNLKNRG